MSGEWKSPPIVAPFCKHRYFVLDGANRTKTMQALAVPHMLVQVVDYDDPLITLSSWNHVMQLSIEEMLGKLSDVTFESHPLSSATALFVSGAALMYLCDRSGKTQVLRNHADTVTRLALLNKIVDAYEGASLIQRTEQFNVSAFNELSNDWRTLVVFPMFTKADLITVITNGDVFPSGITRHLIPGRALRVNIPMALLNDPSYTIEQKQAQVDEILAERYESNRVRFYPEGIYLFDE